VRPQGMQLSRNIVTSLLTVVGVGLFALISFKAINQISDRQYVEGKQLQHPLASLAAAQRDLGVTTPATTDMLQLSTIHAPAVTTAVPVTAQDNHGQIVAAEAVDDHTNLQVNIHRFNELKKGKELIHHED
jgi:hypothetical protein